MLNRTQAPLLKDIEKINFVYPTVQKINSDLELVWMKEVADETVRIELHFNAGTIHSINKVASITNSLLLSGTSKKNSIQINQEINELGVFTDFETNQESAVVAIYCLKENVNSAISLLCEAINECQFPENEIEDVIRERKQQYLISSEKVSFLARREFQKRMYSNSDRYSRQLSIEEYDLITRDKIIDFYNEFYLHGLRKVVVVGNLAENQISFLTNKIKHWHNTTNTNFEGDFKNQKGQFHINKQDALQTAIRIGMPLFNKSNSEFIDFQILQTILGDYFGSRLMSNIREDKGYTYGIGSAVLESYLSGSFIIATEVGSEYVNSTLNEIKKEIERLRNELIPDDELNLVRNYLLGQLLKSADGSNSLMDLYLGVTMHELTLDYYNQVIKRIHTITSEELKKLASKYLNWNDLTIITAGKIE
jgi:zinc protease